MQEPPRINDLNLLVPELKTEVLKLIKRIEFYRLPLRIFETLRSIERQEWVFKRGCSKTMHSRHLGGQAVDFVVYLQGKWSWEKKHYYLYYMLRALVTGCYPKLKFLDWDLPHFELDK